MSIGDGAPTIRKFVSYGAEIMLEAGRAVDAAPVVNLTDKHELDNCIHYKTLGHCGASRRRTANACSL
jgi:hypothetical protein